MAAVALTVRLRFVVAVALASRGRSRRREGVRPRLPRRHRVEARRGLRRRRAAALRKRARPGGRRSGWDSRLWLTLYATGTEQPDGVDRFGPVNERCQAQWYYAYLAQFEPTEAEMRGWIERAWKCLRDFGIEINDLPTIEDATASVASGCEPWREDGASSS